MIDFPVVHVHRTGYSKRQGFGIFVHKPKHLKNYEFQ